jgi:hypothetical protein
MASLIIDTGVESHPQIEITGVDFEKEMVHFRWIGGVYSGDCSEPFTITLADHGALTLTQIVQGLSAQMVALLTASQPE